MLTNEIKKGMRIKLACGWMAKMADNAKGTIRIAEVYGIYTETGSIYAHDIIAVETPDGGWAQVEYTPAQLKTKAKIKA